MSAPDCFPQRHACGIAASGLVLRHDRRLMAQSNRNHCYNSNTQPAPICSLEPVRDSVALRLTPGCAIATCRRCSWRHPMLLKEMQNPRYDRGATMGSALGSVALSLLPGC